MTDSQAGEWGASGTVQSPCNGELHARDWLRRGTAVKVHHVRLHTHELDGCNPSYSFRG